jgi:hypothetical protein
LSLESRAGCTFASSAEVGIGCRGGGCTHVVSSIGFVLSVQEEAVMTFSKLIACASIVWLAVGCGGDGAEGDVECSGSSCVCPSTGDCLVDCTGDCDLQCAGSGACDFICGADCIVDCTGSGPCVVDVGDNSTVDCTGSGGCDVICFGDCSVSCPGSGTCVVECDAADAECLLEGCEEVVSCPDGTAVCNGSCA